MADVYTHGHQESVLAAHRWRTAANSAAYLIGHLKPGDSLLDVGCGVGNITIDLVRYVAPGRVVGIENVEPPLAEGRAAAEQAGVAVEFRLGDAYALDFEDDTFDVVHAHQVLQHVTDPVAVLREMDRVCKPGGLVAARDADYKAATWHPPYGAMEQWLDTYRTLAKGNGAEPDAGRHLRAWALEAGFTDVVSSASVWCFATPADRAQWAGNWSRRVQASAFVHQALERGLATREDLDAMTAAFSEWSGRDEAWSATLHGEILCKVPG